MKPVFGIDITDNKKNIDTNAAPFVTATNEGGQLERFEEGQEELLKAEDRTQMPFLLRLVKWLCGFFAVAVALGVIKAESPAVAFQNAPYLIVGAGVAALLWAVLQYLSVKKKRDALADGGVEQQIEDMKHTVKRLYSDLDVPTDAPCVDVLLFKYKVKDGEIVAKAVDVPTTPYLAVEMCLFRAGDALCLADVEHRYSFSLSSLRAIRTVHKRIAIPSLCWSKDEEPTKGKYKPYKMTVNGIGSISFQPYYILELEHNGETFGIWFPPYERPLFEEVSGLSAEE